MLTCVVRHLTSCGVFNHVMYIRMITTAIKTRTFSEYDDLVDFICAHIPSLTERSIIVITSKIVALAEGRAVPGGTIDDKVRLMKEESELVVRGTYAWLTIRDGVPMASAGIDESNGNGKFILLPKDSFESAKRLRIQLKKRFGIRELGVLITDSRMPAFRSGALGVVLGYAGFRGVRNYRGRQDIFGRKLRFEKANIADALAAAAVLEMGEGNESKPLAVIEGASVTFSERTYRHELFVRIHDDLYVPLYRKLRECE